MKKSPPSTPKAFSSTASSTSAASKTKSSGVLKFPLLFGRSNYLWMLIGLAFIVVGNVMMIGKEDIYSFTKITLAPIVIMAGFLVEIYAIMHRPAARP
jgi:hypothetical protein